MSHLQAELFIGDQNGVIHIWDLKTDNNEQLVGFVQFVWWLRAVN